MLTYQLEVDENEIEVEIVVTHYHHQPSDAGADSSDDFYGYYDIEYIMLDMDTGKELNLDLSDDDDDDIIKLIIEDAEDDGDY